MKKLKFLFISSDKFPPFRVDVSVLFADELAGRGHTIHWILQSEADCDKSYVETWKGGTVWVGATNNRPTLLSRLHKHILGTLNELRMFRVARNNQYDFIQVKDKFFTALLAIIASRINHTKFIFWLSYPFPEADIYEVSTGTARYPIIYAMRGKLRKWLLYKIIIPKAAHVFVQSEQMKKDVHIMGIPNNKMTSVPMGVSLDTIPYKPSESYNNISNSVNRIVYLGTIHKSRKMDFLIRVYKRVLESANNTVLYIVGGSDDPTEQELLEEEANRIKITGEIVYTGFIPRDEAFKYVQNADVCISPFYPTPILNSTSPTKLVEYMAMGKAVVANDHPEQKLIIDSSEAGLCTAYNETDFAEAILKLLNDKQLASDMGIKGRRYVEQNRSYVKIADHVENEYYHIISNQ